MNEFPWPLPERLPSKIDPCPIVEAVVSLRFVSAEPWRNIPGLMAASLRGRYDKVTELPLTQLPETLRQQQAAFTYEPLLQYESPLFWIRLGPRMVSLTSRSFNYPGWNKFREELDWLWQAISLAGFIQEGERLSVRYVDFFEEDIFSLVFLSAFVAEKPIRGLEQSYTVVFPIRDATARLLLNNSAFLQDHVKVRRGSILDLDVWQSLSGSDISTAASAQVEHLHEAAKKLFFGLLKPDTLATLNPAY